MVSRSQISENLNNLNERMLRGDLNRLNLKDMYLHPLEDNCVETKEEREARLKFICENAQNVHSVQMFTSDFQKFDESMENLELSNLKTIYITMNSELCDLIPAEFLNRCPTLEYVRICQPILPFYMNNILMFNNLKRLEICHEIGNDTDDILNVLITHKGPSICRLETQIEKFPPFWLTNSVMEECRKLEDLVLKAPFKEREIDEHLNVPESKILKNFWIEGNVCNTCVMTFVAQCPNLENLFIDQVSDYSIYMNVVMRKRRLEGIRTPLNLIHSTNVLEKITKIDFVYT